LNLSCYFLLDNADLIFQKRALDLLLPKLAKVISNLQAFAMKWKDMPCLGFTHYQPAQLITVGKRAAQWLQNLVIDLEQLETVRRDLKFRGAQGTTGSQASFLEIFKGDPTKIKKLNQILCEKAGFSSCYSVSAQTYTRKVDLVIANAVAGIGATAQQICTDIRHLASQKEMEEPFEKTQIGCKYRKYSRLLAATTDKFNKKNSFCDGIQEKSDAVRTYLCAWPQACSCTREFLSYVRNTMVRAHA
jgi:adenylosuccinate lyase